MMKRHIAIPLLCVVLVAALSFPVFATSTFPYPENNVSGRVLVRFWPIAATIPDDQVIHGGYQLQFGELWSGFFYDSPTGDDDGYSGYSVYTDVSFTLEIYVGGSIFIAVPNNSMIYSDFSSLSSYYDSSGDYTVNFGNTVMKSYTPDTVKSEYVIDQTTAELNVKFLHFKNVPPGNYQISSESMWNGAGAMCFGVYVSQGNAYGAIVDSFSNGSLTYTEALDEMLSFNDSLDPIDSHEATVQALQLQNMISQLNAVASTVAAKNAAVLDSKMESTINSFAGGSISMKTAVDSLSSDYTEALAGAQTVDEAQAVLAVYKANLKQLEAQSEIQLIAAFDSLVSDQEVQKSDDYYAAEDELLQSFDVAEFDAMLKFDAWYLQLPSDEAARYKSFFDYILNDSSLKLFVIIPLTMGLVTILLGTRMRVKPDNTD